MKIYQVRFTEQLNENAGDRRKKPVWYIQQYIHPQEFQTIEEAVQGAKIRSNPSVIRYEILEVVRICVLDTDLNKAAA